jgi:hypothetical protein
MTAHAARRHSAWKGTTSESSGVTPRGHHPSSKSSDVPPTGTNPLEQLPVRGFAPDVEPVKSGRGVNTIRPLGGLEFAYSPFAGDTTRPLPVVLAPGTFLNARICARLASESCARGGSIGASRVPDGEHP